MKLLLWAFASLWKGADREALAVGLCTAALERLSDTARMRVLQAQWHRFVTDPAEAKAAIAERVRGSAN